MVVSILKDEELLVEDLTQGMAQLSTAPEQPSTGDGEEEPSTSKKGASDFVNQGKLWLSEFNSQARKFIKFTAFPPTVAHLVVQLSPMIRHVWWLPLKFTVASPCYSVSFEGRLGAST
eukprot:g83320.t1